MFPAPAGMNRTQPRCELNEAGVPRTRGDEPMSRQPYAIGDYVFPAPAGMNRIHWEAVAHDQCVPRTRGDEPQVQDSLAQALECSPHPRG